MPADEPDIYLAILKASYDYEPQSDDEIAIKEDQLLLLLERVDDECVLSPLTLAHLRTLTISSVQMVESED
jgi:hypothetical protein